MTRPARIPTEAQARLAADRAAEILARLEANGAPAPTALNIGPVRLEFGTSSGDNAPAQREGSGPWDGKAFG